MERDAGGVGGGVLPQQVAGAQGKEGADQSGVGNKKGR